MWKVGCAPSSLQAGVYITNEENKEDITGVSQQSWTLIVFRLNWFLQSPRLFWWTWLSLAKTADNLRCSALDTRDLHVVMLNVSKYQLILGARDSAVGWGTCYKPKGRGLNWNFSLTACASSRTMALCSIQSLWEMRTRNILWGAGDKIGQCVRMTTLPPSCASCLQMWEPQSPGTLTACPVK
jgi:hypothetical protein